MDHYKKTLLTQGIFLIVLIVIYLFLTTIEITWESMVFIPVILMLSPLIVMIILGEKKADIHMDRLLYPVGVIALYLVVMNGFMGKLVYHVNPEIVNPYIRMSMLFIPLIVLVIVCGFTVLVNKQNNKQFLIKTFNLIFTGLYYLFIVTTTIIWMIRFIIID